MNNLIAKSYPVSMGMNWLVAVDERALGMDSCGCEKAEKYPPERTVEKRLYGQLIQVTFRHRRSEDNNNAFCMMAFTAADYRPLEFKEYLSAFNQEAVDE